MDAPNPSRPERVLIIQLARLGDIVQSLPAFVAVRARHPQAQVDLLCASPLVSVAELFPSLNRTIGWDGACWREWGRQWANDAKTVMRRAASYVDALRTTPYGVAYNLNQHGRAIVAAHLLADRVVGPGGQGVLSPVLPPWAAYLRKVAEQRGANRVHLADALCGLCGVRPPAVPPRLQAAGVELPVAFLAIGQTEGPWVALVVGAGDAERVIPPSVWSEWIARFMAASPAGQVVLIGAGPERDAARTIQDRLTSLEQGRLWDTTGRLSLRQLAACLQRCQWVIGGDTGPLHLGAAVGARAIGWYVARARVHETGPYGTGHWVWQLGDITRHASHHAGSAQAWPVEESVELILKGACESSPNGWSLWRSGFDAFGTSYSSNDAGSEGRAREDVWRVLESARPVEAVA